MNWQEIEHLLEKYYEGNTLLHEEEELLRFFNREDIPPHLAKLKPQFAFLKQEREAGMDDPGFDERFMGLAREKGIGKLLNLKDPLFYWVTGIAATILILVAVFVRFNPFGNTIKDTYSDPQLAYNEAKQVLLFVSGKFNQGTSKLGPIAKFSDGIGNLAIINTYNEGLQKASDLEKFTDIIQIN